MAREPLIHIAESKEDAAETLSAWVAQAAQEDVRDHRQSSWALSGGSTPVLLYHRLSLRSDIPWSEVCLYVVDERDVVATDPLSNAHMIEEALIDRLPDAPEWHPWLTVANPSESLARYRQQLAPLPRSQTGFPQLDLALMGMGDDGHTASVFPGSPQETVQDWVAFGPGPNAPRLTLTLPLLAQARRIAFLVTGLEKSARVAECIRSDANLPAAWLSRHGHNVHWFLDRESARDLG